MFSGAWGHLFISDLESQIIPNPGEFTLLLVFCVGPLQKMESTECLPLHSLLVFGLFSLRRIFFVPFFFNCTYWKQRAAGYCPLSHSHMLSNNETVISHSPSTCWLQRTGIPPEWAVSRAALQITSSVRHYGKLCSQIHLGILHTESFLEM